MPALKARRSYRWIFSPAQSHMATVMKRRLSVQMMAASALLLLGGGCTHATKAHFKARTELDEHSRALTTAVVDALQLQPESSRDPFTGLALRLAAQDQRVEGLPLEPVPVGPLLGMAAGNTSSNLIATRRAVATAEVEKRFSRIETLIARERDAGEQLAALGAHAEAERNERITRSWKRGGGGIILLGGLIALCVFFPAAIPIAGQVVGVIVSRVPALAGAAGVVSVKAFDAVVKAVERSKAAGADTQNHPNIPLGNSLPSDPAWIERLHLNLSREMDSAHKRLVRQRKETLGLNG